MSASVYTGRSDTLTMPRPMQIHHLYTVPLIEFTHPEREQLCSSLRPFFLAREQAQYKDDIERDTQLGELFESRFDLFYWKDPELQPLVQFVHASLARTVMELNAYEPAFMERLRFDYHAWFHITRSGGFQGVHNHPNASWSGIFCVDPGAPGKDAREGTVRFYDPRANADYYTDPGNQNLQAPFRNGGTEVRHEPGKLWLFPSYLLHEVFPYFGNTPRIVVAFNCWLGADQRPGRMA